MGSRELKEFHGFFTGAGRNTLVQGGLQAGIGQGRTVDETLGAFGLPCCRDWTWQRQGNRGTVQIKKENEKEKEKEQAKREEKRKEEKREEKKKRREEKKREEKR